MPQHLIFDPYVDTEGKHRWRLTHTNGNILADSAEGYENLGDMMTAWNTILVSLQTASFEYRTIQ